jgi:hypothetical protein
MEGDKRPKGSRFGLEVLHTAGTFLERGSVCSHSL